MNIGLYISELLFENDFVVLPGIGEFSTKYIPARFIPEARKIESPSKIAHFNPDIVSQESLLASHIAQMENKSIFEARHSLDMAVQGMLNSLDSGQRVVLHRLGVLYKNPSGVLDFEPDLSVNYLAESAGMGIISEPAKPLPPGDNLVSIQEQNDRIQQTKDLEPQGKPESAPRIVSFAPKAEPTSSARPQRPSREIAPEPPVTATGVNSTVKWFVWLFLPIVIVAIFLVFNWRFIVGEEGVDLTQPAPREAVQQAPVEEATQPPVEQPPVAEVPAGEHAGNYDPAKKYYYIVVGSFQSLKAANQLVEEINRRSPGMARVFMQTPEGFHRVSYGFYNTEDQANAQLQHVRESVSQGAWIFYH